MGLGGNRQLGSRPRLARLLAGPSRLLTGDQGPVGGVGWIHTGTAATLAGSLGARLRSRIQLPHDIGDAGFATRSTPGAVTLTVDGQLSTSATLDAASCTDAHRLCLGADRFVLDLDWQAPGGRTGLGRPQPLTDDTGVFWFFRDSNLELLTKVLDGTPVDGHHRLFAGALTNVGYQLWGFDGERGTLRRHVNPLGPLTASRSARTV